MPRCHYKKYRDITLLARNMRKNMTSSESLLWEILRRKSFKGYKFLRQHTIFYRIDKNQIEFFVADFYCSKLRLVLEVDGPIHDLRQDYDRERDLKLKNKGITVFRLRNDELQDMNYISSKIMDIIEKCCIDL